MIGIVDYGMGNLRSVQKALQKVGGRAEIISSPGEIDRAEKLVLPGVGAFADAIDRLRATHLDEMILRAVREGRWFLGICLGYQMLFDVSYEDGEHTGLGVFPGKVVKFDFPSADVGQNLKVPHMGWNALSMREGCPLFTGIDNGAYVYFVHSYYPVPLREEIIAATADYGRPFTAAVWENNVLAVQFHPEKSQAVGMKMLKNFVEL
jgi:glutamine amidotransferase